MTPQKPTDTDVTVTDAEHDGELTQSTVNDEQNATSATPKTPRTRATRKRRGGNGEIVPVLISDRMFLLPHMSVPLPIEDPEIEVVIDAAMHTRHRRLLILLERPVANAARESVDLETRNLVDLMAEMLSMGDEEGARLLLENRDDATLDLDRAQELMLTDDDFELCEWGVLAEIGQYMGRPGGQGHVILNGLSRARVKEFTQEEPIAYARIEEGQEVVSNPERVEVMMSAVLGLVEQYVAQMPNVPNEVLDMVKAVDDPAWLSDLIAFSPDFTSAQRQEMVETLDPLERLHKLSIMLQRRMDVLDLRQEIQSEAQAGMDRQNREYFLREQMRAIQKELGEGSSEEVVANELRERIDAAGMPEDVKLKAVQQLERLEQQHPFSPEIGVIRTYIEWLVDLPWQHQTEDRLDLTETEMILNQDHYGLDKVKDRIIEFIAVRKLAGDKLRTPILCFVGPPGVGKTSLGKSIARATGREYVRMSLGGVRDEAEIRGHRRTYVGAMPGRVIKAMKDAGSRNPVIVLDEVDKLGSDTFRGDPSSALLEVLDPEQNTTFSDHYLEVPYDLSQVIFITTANMLDPIPAALRDRMEIIEVSGYTELEKLEIAREFLLPKLLESHGLTPRKLVIGDDALKVVIREYTEESGVRNLEREIGSLIRKIARRFAGEKPPRKVTVKATDVKTYLGVPRYDFNLAEEDDDVGVATGAAVTSVGGDLLSIEVTIFEGKGDLQLTGQLGDVMQESARAALSYARTRREEFGLPEGYFDKHTIHVHIPAGAIPKDGPSAGITMATALISALTNKQVRKDVAMTGEITLRGKVLPIGGLREKTLAAHRGGIKTFILPAKNAKDVSELPDVVKDDLELIEVSHLDDVLDIAFVGSKPKRASRATGGSSKRKRAPKKDPAMPNERNTRIEAPGNQEPIPANART